jgi:hypothetical protein
MDMVLLPASLMAEEEFPSYLSREWIAKQLAAPDFPRSDLWSVIHGALIYALEECAKANKAKMEYQSDGDGFFTYKGTIDVNVTHPR